MAPEDHAHSHPLPANTPPGEGTKRVVDPVCGMKIDPERARGGSLEHAGTRYYFCNPKCHDRFAADPAKYLAAPTPAPAPAPITQSTVVYVCPMDPEVRSDKPGACPKCGMALEPEQPTAEADTSELRDMSRRFWISVALSAPLLLLAMGSMLPGHVVASLVPGRTRGFLELALATPVLPVVGLTVSGARARLGEKPQLEHVHADRPRRERRVLVQPRGVARARLVPHFDAHRA
jgi:Cu+-exporting ATPase